MTAWQLGWMAVMPLTIFIHMLAVTRTLYLANRRERRLLVWHSAGAFFSILAPTILLCAGKRKSSPAAA